MFLVVFVTLLNAMGSSNGFLNPTRISVGGAVPVGLLDLCIGIAFLWAIFRGGNAQMAYPRLRMHPLIPWLMALWGIAWVGGTIGSLGVYAPLREILQSMRDYGFMPICIFIGYRALATPRSSQAMAYWVLIAGVGNAIMLLVRFYEASGRVQIESDNVNPLRQIDYMTAYCSIGFVLCVYSVMSGLRIVRPWLAACLGSLCLLGACASVSRTTLVCIFFGLLALYWLLPRGKRAAGMFKMALLAPVIALSLWGGLTVASDLTHRDFSKVMSKQIESLLPESEDNGKKDKAWDTRIPSLKLELQLFSSSPLFGRGFTSVTEYIAHGGVNWGAFGHNSYTLVMARTGLFGLGALGLTIGSSIVLGRRMVREQVDRPSILLGAVGFIAGCNILVSAGCTMMFGARGAIYFALMCGLMIRAREIQETTRELNTGALPLEDEYETDLDVSHHLDVAPYL